MNHYYKQGCCKIVENPHSQALVERGRIAGILDLPEPIPTIVLYLLLVAGAIFWVKAGGL